MGSKNTRLRYVFSKDPEALVEWLNAIPFKVEIKGNPVVVKNKFYLFFVLPDDVEHPTGDLDG